MKVNLKNLKDSPKKIWRKEFSKEELKEIFGAVFESLHDVFEVPFEKWYHKKTEKIVNKYGFLMHLETDRYDNLTGIKPETVKEYLGNYTLNDFKAVLDKINIYLRVVPEANLRQSRVLAFDSTEGTLSLECDTTFRNFVHDNGEMLKEIAIFFGEKEALGSDFWDNWKDYLKAKNDLIVYRKIISELEIPLAKFVKEGVSLILEKRKEQWKDRFKRVPQVKELILVNPNNFDFKEHNKIIVEVYGKQLKDLSEDDRKIVCQTIDALGKNLNMQFLNAFEDKKIVFNYFQNKELHGEAIPVVSNELTMLNGFAELDNAEKIQSVLYAAKLKSRNIIVFENLINSWKKRKNVKKAINLFVSVLKYLDSINYNNVVIDGITKINDTYPFFKTLYRYTGGNIFNPFSEELIRLMDMYNKRSSEHNIPLISGKVGDYSYEILSKDDPTGLVLGYATDCCQTAYGPGAPCIEFGFNNPDSGFFKVEKKNTIYAQSWIWQVEIQGIKVLVFDSIEFLGDDLNQYAIIPAYEETAKKLISEYNYDLVVAVSSPNVALDSVPWPIHEFEFFSSNDFAENGYFDFLGRGHILGISKNKTLKEILKQECEEQDKDNIYAYLKEHKMIYKRAKKEN